MPPHLGECRVTAVRFGDCTTAGSDVTRPVVRKRAGKDGHLSERPTRLRVARPPMRFGLSLLPATLSARPHWQGRRAA